MSSWFYSTIHALSMLGLELTKIEGAIEKSLPNAKSPLRRAGFSLKYNAGDHLISHTLARAVPSAQRVLTSVFGMGTGGTLAVWSPANLRRLQIRLRQNLGALGGLFLPQPNPVNGWFIPDKKRQTGAIQPNISQRNRLVHYMAC